MRLIDRYTVGTALHRSGWPRVMQELRTLEDGRGCLLDDFTDASFSYQRLPGPHKTPWVGIFHHPVKIASPLKADRKFELREIEKHDFWHRSRESLCGAIALCDEVRVDLERWLGVPAITLHHPTETSVPQWSLADAMEAKIVLQAGYCMRNTQAIYQINPPGGWRRIALFGGSPHYRRRNRELMALRLRPDVERARVKTIRRLCDAEYDAMLAKSVVVSELFGAAANNLVVECLVRGTPLAVNRLPAVEEYLGADYPLYFETIQGVHQLLDPERLQAASEHFKARAAMLPSFAQFATSIRDFCERVYP